MAYQVSTFLDKALGEGGTVGQAVARCVTALEGACGPKQAELASVLVDLADELARREEHAEVEPLLRRALSIEAGGLGTAGKG